MNEAQQQSVFPDAPTLTKGPRLAPAASFAAFAEVLVPGGYNELLTYGIPEGVGIRRGSVVWVSLGTRKAPLLALVLRVHQNRPSFALKPLQPHPSAFHFDDSFLESLDWCAKFYCCPQSQSLDVFWPSDLSKLLDTLHTQPKRKVRTFASRVPTQIEQAHSLTLEQQQALEQLSPMLNGTGFRGALLHGVTGSGKTRVYLELVQQALALGQTCLILVPEIALTPQTRERFQTYIGEEVYVLHSNLSAPERRHSWNAILSKQAKVVLGTRSAILAPGISPSLIIIDEEHDGSYKQQDPAPRYHCRELAFHLAHRNGACVVLGSATPSLESWEYAQRGHLKLVQLKERANPVPMPKVQVIDLRKQAKQDRSLMLSPAMREGLYDAISQGQQAIILHNRRGYSTSRACAQCGDILECTHCKVPVVEHRQHNGLLCHYCGRLFPKKSPCPKCGCADFVFSGGAIEKVEEEILAWIPQAKILRMDRDRIQNIGSAEKMLAAFRAGEANILLGTQMVAKGHDFPNVQFVGVVAADIGAALPDFRATERTFQLLAQVSGRAGRAQVGGRVLLQTWNPQDQVLQFALKHDYEGFARWELQNRKELGYPPFQRFLSLELTGRDKASVEKLAEILASSLRQQSGIQILGPTDAFIAMIRGHHRMHLILKGPTPQILRTAAEIAVKDPQMKDFTQIQIRIDMDPLGLL